MKMSLATLIALVALVGCQAQPRPPAADEQTRAASDTKIRLPQGRIFEAVSDRSEFRIVTWPAGPLARFGHAHVIGGSAVSGQVVLAEDFHASGLRLVIAVAALELDRPEWRLDEGFDPDLPEDTIRDTRDNLLSDALLNADEYPEILIEAVSVNGPPWQPDIDLRITLAGTARELTVPITLDIADQELAASGRISLRQSDFGIEPFSAAGGNLQVADDILIRFRIVARRVD
jgi:polyisoprenoid-binding protein YceI